MKENEKFLKESVDLLGREFGQPLPTLKTVMEKHQNNLLETPAAIAAGFSKSLFSLLTRVGKPLCLVEAYFFTSFPFILFAASRAFFENFDAGASPFCIALTIPINFCCFFDNEGIILIF